MDLKRVKSFFAKGLEDFDADACKDTKPIEPGTVDAKYDFKPPEDGMVVRVHSKILGGYEKPVDARQAAYQRSVGQDSLWLTAEDKKKLIEAVRKNGDIPTEIAYRIARYNLIDNTRGEPPRWDKEQVKSIKMKVNDGVVTGSVKLSTEDAKRGYDAEIFGHIDVEGEEVTRFDLAAEGKFWGEGRHTGWAPKGKFPLAITFRLVDASTAEGHVIPHGAKGWLDGYYQCAN